MTVIDDRHELPSRCRRPSQRLDGETSQSPPGRASLGPFFFLKKGEYVVERVVVDDGDAVLVLELAAVDDTDLLVLVVGEESRH